MGELSNCPNCNQIFIPTPFRDVCENCYKEEEKAYEDAYKYIRKRENRTATIDQVVEGTGVEEELILKFIKKGRFKLSQFPNLGYPCERCGKQIREGKLCLSCTDEIRSDLKLFQSEEERKKEIAKRDQHSTYHRADEKN